MKGGVGGKYVSYRIAWFEGGEKRTEFKRDRDEARLRAEEIAKLISEGRSELAGITVLEREMMLDIQRQILPTKLTLQQVVARFMENWEPDIKETSVKDAFVRFTEDKKHVGEFHKKDIRLHVGGLSKKFGKRMMSSLKRDEVLSYVAKGYSNGRTKNNRLNSIKGFFNWAKHNQFVSERNPHILEKVKPYPEETSEGYVNKLMPSSDLMKILVSACDRPDKDQLLIVAGLEAFTGIRVSELKRLTWENIKYDDKGNLLSIYVPPRSAKMKRRRGLQITDSLKNLFKWIKRKKNGKLTEYEDVQRILTRIAKKEGIKWHTNTLRHSFITHQLELTGDIGRVSLGAGNSADTIETNYKELSNHLEAKAWFEVGSKLRLRSLYQQLKNEPIAILTKEEKDAMPLEDAPDSVDDDAERVKENSKN